LLIGGMSHFFLDAFTHDYGFFVKRVSFLQNELFLFNSQVSVYGFLQILLSILGLLGIAWFIAAKKPEKVAHEKDVKRSAFFWGTFIFFSIAFLLIRLWVDSVHKSLVDLLIAAISCGIISLFLTSLLFFQNNLLRRIVLFAQRK
jgi:multidrug transporter EmrE-like cation transporter